jgi:hypothetical protein
MEHISKLRASTPNSNSSGFVGAVDTIKGKHVCRINVGSSTGPKTEAGRQRCAAAKTTHGRATREKRQLRAEKLRELRGLEIFLRAINPDFPGDRSFLLQLSMNSL